jgi:uncharacterized membrane protein
MVILVLGLVLFGSAFGAHRGRWLAHADACAPGRGCLEGLYSVVSIVGLGLVVWGYGLARQEPVVLWNPPVAMRHMASLFTLVAFVLLLAAYVPRNVFKARLHHPMVLAVKTWALGHLISNGNLADVALFGGFLLWAVLDFRAARQRDRALGTSYPSGTLAGTGITVVLGAWPGGICLLGPCAADWHLAAGALSWPLKEVPMKGNFAAVVLVVVGSFMLLTNLGIIDVSLRELLHTWWPVVLIGVGIALFVTPERIKKK